MARIVRVFWTVCACVLIRPNFCLNDQKYGSCNENMGLESMKIPDDAITASSYNSSATIPQHVRKSLKGGKSQAWCPKGETKPDSNEWLQVDLRGLYSITYVQTLGRMKDGSSQFFSPFLRIAYKREEEGPWIFYKNKTGGTHIRGNRFAYEFHVLKISPVIIARKLRFYPTVAEGSKKTCLRIELYGCNWTQNIVWYSAPQGHRRNKHHLAYTDHIYDGTVTETYLSGGLGLLTDDHYPSGENLRHKEATEWLGWRMKSPSTPIEITFKFETVRNFSKVQFFASNDYQKNVKIFKEARVFFSIGGQYYTKTPIIYPYTRDKVISFARTIPIQLYNSIGRYVKFQLFFDDKWILLGEVKFTSTRAKGEFTPEKPPPTPEMSLPDFIWPLKPDKKPSGSTVQTETNDDNDKPNKILNVFKSHDSKSSTTISSATHVPGSAEFKQEYVGIVSGIVITKVFIILLIVIVIYYRRRRKKYSRQPSPVSSTKPLAPPTDLMNGMNKLPYNTLATSDVESEKEHCLYSEPEIVFMQRQQLPYYNYCPKPPPSPPPFPKHFNVCERSRQLTELERDNLKFLEKLGGGQFGEVHLCEVIDKNCLAEEFQTEEEKFLVAVKTLNEQADETARKDFQRELTVMARLKDPNVVQVVGVITKEEPMCVATEYMIHGDMNQFLRQRVLDTAGTIARKGKKQLSYGCLIYMSTQVASGMKYLESLNLVHRDLACRNCLVGRHYSVKISDFGMSRNLYSGDYYRIEGKAVLPIRWMAWESILLGKFSSKSDVWSMGVTLWEMLTFAKEQPFTNMSDEEVIENCGHFYRNDDQEQYLPQPSLCPREIYDLMKECWNRDEANRPSFLEIHMFLQRKNMGYRPREDEFPL